LAGRYFLLKLIYKFIKEYKFKLILIIKNMNNNIKEISIAPRTYIVWRKEIEIKDIANQQMWQDAFRKVNEYIQKHGIEYAGPGAGLYFTWDEPKGMTDFAIGMQVSGVTEVADPELSIINIPESKASVMTVNGDYSQLMDSHMKMVDYTEEKGIETGLTIEEYTVTGMQKPDSKEWETNLYYIHTTKAGE
jgi:effector-binding domain-containing protein